MTFKIMGMGKQMAKSANGFSGKGDWDLLKCFYENKGNYAEFYLNINWKEGIAELKMKDVDYAPILEEAFGREMNGYDRIRAEEAQVDELEAEAKAN
jgi:hypothetical protein